MKIFGFYSWQHFATKLNHLLKWVEIAGLLIFLVWFLLNLFFLDNLCITGVCINRFMIDGNLYHTVVHYILPFFCCFGLIRIALNYFSTKKQDSWGLSFYLALIGLMACYISFAVYSREFFWFNDKEAVQPDSIQAIYTLIWFGFTSILLLKNKFNWDGSTFFIKFRIVVYIFHIVLMMLNLNIGVLAFAIFSPALIYTDLIKRSHFYWE